MQRTITLLLVTVLLFTLSPMMNASAQEGDTIDGSLLEQMTVEEQLRFETAMKEMFYVLYEVQARQLAEQEDAQGEEVFSIYPLTPEFNEEDLAIGPPPAYKMEEATLLVF